MKRFVCAILILATIVAPQWAFAVDLSDVPVLGVGGQAWANVFARSKDPRNFDPSNNPEAAVVNRICSIERGTNGALIAVVEILRHEAQDGYTTGFVIKVSYDGGRTWGATLQLGTHANDNDTTRQSNPTICCDLDGTCHLVYGRWDAYSTPLAPQLKVLTRSAAYPYTTWTGEDNITSSVVKQTDAGLPTCPLALQNGDDPWLWCLPTRAILVPAGRPNAGRIIVGCVTRTVLGTGDANPSYIALICREPNGTWRILGGPSVSHPDPEGTGGGTTNKYGNELDFAHNAAGQTVAMCRIASGVNANKLYQFTCDDDGVCTNLSDSLIAANSTQPAIHSDPRNRDHMIVTCPYDTGVRSKLAAYYSLNGGSTWTFGTVLYQGRAAYSDIIDTSTSGRFLAHFERGGDFTTWPIAHEFVSQVEFTWEHVVAGSQPPITLTFDELPSGKAMRAESTVVDSTGGVNAKGNTAWTYAANGVSADGSTAVTLDPLRTDSTHGTAWTLRQADNATWEFGIDFTNFDSGGATQQYFGDATGATGVWMSADTTSDTMAFTIRDANSHATTCTHSQKLNLGSARKKIQVVRNIAADTLTMYIDGVAGTPVTDLTDSSVSSSAACIIGEDTAGNNPVPSGTVYEFARFTRGVVSTSQFLSAKAAISTYTPASGCKLFFDPVVAGRYFGAGPTVAFPYSPLPMVSGYGVASWHDFINNVTYTTPNNTKFQAALTDTSSAGTCVSFGVHANSTNGVNLQSNSDGTTASTSLDFWHQDGDGQIVMILVPEFRDGGNTQVIISNQLGSAAGASKGGFRLFWDDSADKIGFSVSYNTSFIFNESFSPVLNSSKTYLVVVNNVGGMGSKPTMKYADLTNGVPGSLTAASAVAGTLAPNNAVDKTSEKSIAIGCRPDNSDPWRGGLRHLSIYDSVHMDDAQVLDFAKSLVGGTSGGGGLNLGLDLGFGAVERRDSHEYTLAP